MKRALLGFHGESDEFFVELGLQLDFEGYLEWERVNSVDEMLEKMGLSADSIPDMAPQKPYDLYVMDVNLGSPNSTSYSQAAAVYEHVKEAVKAGEARFLAVSANEEAVKAAKEAGIPCCDKMKTFDELFD